MWKLLKTRSAETETEGRLVDVLERLRDHEARLKGLETEWLSVYQKMTRALGHVTKTAALDAPKPNGQDKSPQAQRSLDDLTRDEIARL